MTTTLSAVRRGKSSLFDKSERNIVARCRPPHRFRQVLDFLHAAQFSNDFQYVGQCGLCMPEFRGRKRTVMTPNSYTELFFLDEATALAAGHRPCAECRHARFLDFCNAWKMAHGKAGSSQRPTANEIDSRLHTERLAADQSKRLFDGRLDDLPNGVFVKVEAWSEQAFLIWGDSLCAWSLGGYREHQVRPRGEKSSW